MDAFETKLSTFETNQKDAFSNLQKLINQAILELNNKVDLFVRESASRLEKLKELQDMVNVNIEMGKLLDRRVATNTQD